MRKLRVGLLSWAHVHAPGLVAALSALEQVDYIGSFDDSGSPHTGRTHATLDALLRECEAVVIASTNAGHHRYTLAAARAGVHVLCEKPLATTIPDAAAMIEACRAAGVQLGVALPVRSSPTVIALRESIQNGALGRVRAVRATNPGQYPGGWFGDPIEAGGGAAMDHTVHVADALRWLLTDEVVRVHAELGSFLYALPVEDCGVLTLDFAGGAFATIDCSWSRPATYPTWGGVTMHVVGERGTVDIDVFRQSLTHYDDTSGKTRLAGWGDDLTALTIAGFVDAILGGRPVPISGEDGLRSLEVVAAAYRSAELRRPVETSEV
ncbi:MAG: Gfo/Idh/MocA family oxidoreductase [Chloroflexota bacterium]